MNFQRFLYLFVWCVLATSSLRGEHAEILVDRFPNEKRPAYDSHDNSGIFFYHLKDYLSPKGKYFNKREIIKLVAYAQSSRGSLTPQVSFLNGRSILFSKIGDLDENSSDTTIVQATFQPYEFKDNKLIGDIYWYVTHRSQRIVTDSGKKKDVVLTRKSSFGFSNADLRLTETPTYPNNGYIEIHYRIKK
jgi:hypothetical protein